MSDLTERLVKGFGSSAGRGQQVVAYQGICVEAAGKIKQLKMDVKILLSYVKESDSYDDLDHEDKAIIYQIDIGDHCG